MLASHEILARMLKEAEAVLPPGTRARNVTTLADTMLDADKICFDFITEYERELMHPAMTAPTIWTIGSVTSTRELTEDSIRRSVMRQAERHNDDWSFIHSAEYAAALAKTKAAHG